MGKKAWAIYMYKWMFLSGLFSDLYFDDPYSLCMFYCVRIVTVNSSSPTHHTHTHTHHTHTHTTHPPPTTHTHTHTHAPLLAGARDDLEKVTGMAYRQVAEFGMSPVIGHISLPPQAGGKRSYSQKLSHMIDEVSVLCLNYLVEHVYSLSLV